MPTPPWTRALSYLLSGALLALALCACGQKKGGDASNDHLKAGLLALDRGDESEAERELNLSLSERPKNADARVALASIYARRAGFPMKVWLDPLMDAGKEVDSKMRAYQSAGDLQRNLRDEDAEIDDATANFVAPDPKTQDLKQLKDRIRSIYANLGKVTVGVMVAIDLFEALPYLEEAQLANLDHAIAVLRADDPNPDNRSEKVKVYLAALALMKFVHHLRAFVGSFDQEAKKIFTQSSRFCTLDAPSARKQVDAIHDALLLVEEGLRIREADASNIRLRARRQLHDFVQVRLLGEAWSNVDKFFEQGSEQNYVVMRYVSRLCGAGKKPGKGEEGPRAGPGGPPGASLWDPDADDAAGGDPAGATGTSTATSR